MFSADSGILKLREFGSLTVVPCAFVESATKQSPSKGGFCGRFATKYDTLRGSAASPKPRRWHGDSGIVSRGLAQVDRVAAHSAVACIDNVTMGGGSANGLRIANADGAAERVLHVTRVPLYLLFDGPRFSGEWSTGCASMFGFGSLLWGVTSLAAAVIVDRVNQTITVHNYGKPVRWSVDLSGLLDRSDYTGLGGRVVWSGIPVWVSDQTAHLDQTYDCHCHHHRRH